jgi:ElaB/YqjD/DUF883 family membrane-anchored ribosome-binding protein
MPEPDHITSQQNPFASAQAGLKQYLQSKETELMPTDFLGKQATVEDLIREVSRIRIVVTDAVEEGVQSAMKAMKQGRHAAEDAIDDARHTIKQKPFQAMGIVFGAGVLAGGIIAWLGTRRR